MASVDAIATFASAPSGSNFPDLLTTGGGFVFAAYTNGADSTGASGSSTIVQYDNSGNAVFTYTIAGSSTG